MRLKLTATCLIVSLTVFAQDTIKYKHVIKANPLSLLTLKAVVAYEAVLIENLTAVIQGGYIFRNLTAFGYNQEGFNVIGEIRYYPSAQKVAPEGFFIGPFGKLSDSYYNLETIYGPEIFTDKVFGGGIVGGSQWIKNNGFILEILSGIGFGVSEIDYEDPLAGDYTSPRFLFRIGFKVGKAF